MMSDPTPLSVPRREYDEFRSLLIRIDERQTIAHQASVALDHKLNAMEAARVAGDSAAHEHIRDHAEKHQRMWQADIAAATQSLRDGVERIDAKLNSLQLRAPIIEEMTRETAIALVKYAVIALVFLAVYAVAHGGINHLPSFGP